MAEAYYCVTLSPNNLNLSGAAADWRLVHGVFLRKDTQKTVAFPTPSRSTGTLQAKVVCIIVVILSSAI